VPALAVADALRAEGAEVSFLGARDRPEASLVPAAGYEIDLFELRGLDRRHPLRAARGAWLAAVAIPAARRIMRRRKVDVVMGGGGYVAGPAGLAAAALRLPLVLTEADRHLGLANRLLAQRARRICLAFPIPGREDERYVVTGRPVPAAILSADRAAARDRYGIAPDARCLLVFGGSQGALSINEAALGAFVDDPAIDRDYHVLHIAGSRDYEMARERLAAAGDVPAYTLVEYEPTLADPLAACDLVLARAGGSVFEIAAARRPAVLVPYPFAAGRHQHANAAWMAESGAAVVILDSQLEPAALAATVGELLADGARLERMAVAAGALARPDAAQRVAAEILASVSGGEAAARGTS
jgi:UDP-N-acetylglucosamine--N-acetylmuramyl-(pentapeptide) pyrophosphoryl-undecaprenol N-acetylglucosamine transferase